MEPVVAMVAEEQQGEVVAGCWAEEVEVASYPWEGAADLPEEKSDFSFIVPTV